MSGKSGVLSVSRRTFLAMVGASSLAACSSRTPRSPDRQQPDDETTMNADKVYKISDNYYVGTKRKRPPANEAEGSIWEVTNTDGSGVQRTLSDGERWLTLNVENATTSEVASSEQYLMPADGFGAIQEAIDRTEGNTVIRLAPGTYTGKELTLANGVLLEGAGRRATTIKLEDGANTDLVRTPDIPNENVQQCTLRDITFDGNKENNSSGNVVYGAFWNSRFVDCEFTSSPNHGFWLAGSSASTDDNHFRGCYFIENAGIGLKGGGNKQSYPSVGVVRVDTNWFGYNGGPAIAAQGNSWKIVDSKFYGNARTHGPTIELDRCTVARVAGCDLSAETPERSLITVMASKGVSSVGVQITDNDFREEYRAAVRCLADGSDITAMLVRGNTVQSDGNCKSGVIGRAESGGSFINCAVRDNTFVGRFNRSKLALPDTWVVEGNLNAS